MEILKNYNYFYISPLLYIVLYYVVLMMSLCTLFNVHTTHMMI